MKKTIRLGTRKSPLALAQAEQVRAALLLTGKVEKVEIFPMTTSGDENKQDAIAEWGYKGLFTKEIEEGLLESRLDIAVHSMKDMPSELPDGLMLAATLPREDVRDALICEKAADLHSLPEGAVIGTASTRRGAQLRAIRPDLKIVEFRGRVETRLRKLQEGQVDATLLAMAGLNRLGLSHLATLPIPISDILPAIGQAAIGIECRSADAEIRAILDEVNDAETFTAITAERIVLGGLDGSCKTPIGGYASIEDGTLYLQAQVLSPDGSQQCRAQAAGKPEEAEAIAGQVVEQLLTQGAKELLGHD